MAFFIGLTAGILGVIGAAVCLAMIALDDLRW